MLVSGEFNVAFGTIETLNGLNGHITEKIGRQETT